MSSLLSRLNSPNGRVAVLALTALIGAGALKTYHDATKVTPTTQRDDMVSWLTDHQRFLTEDPKVAAALPKVTPWWPADMPCGASIPFPTPEKPPFFGVIRPPKDKDITLDFQVRIHRSAPGQIVWLARRDRDCDGHYEVHRLETPIDGNGEVVTVNLGE